MPSRIIKQGSTRALNIHQFSFGENAIAAAPLTDQREWMDIPSISKHPMRQSPLGSQTLDSSQDMDALEQAAYQRGFLQGEKTSVEAAGRSLEDAMRRYAESIGKIQGLRSSLYVQSERDLVQLALAVAQKIVQREISIDRDIVQTLVHVALSHVSEKSAVTLCLHPEDHAYMLKHLAEISQAEGRDITLVADKSVERGGCLIHTNCGDIDARIEERFREVEKAFFEGVN